MNAIILPYKNGSRSGAALANALGVRQIRLAGSTIHRQRSKTIINWGNSGRNLPPHGIGDQHEMINTCHVVSDAADKLRTFNVLGSSSTRIPEYTTEFEIACEWLDEGAKVVERHQLTGHSGEGINIVEESDYLSSQVPLYVKYVKKQDEYRVHIMDGQVIDVQRKARRSDVPDEDVNWQVRNHQNGFCYMRENVNPDTDVIVQALNAIEALGLDFGAVDVIWNAHQNKAYVLEVNTACGLEGTTLERYKVAFQELLTLGEVTPLEGYELGAGDEDDEPRDEAFASDETYALDAGEDVQTPAQPAPPRQELTPETLRVGMRLRALQSNFHGTDLQVGDIVTVRSVNNGRFSTTRSFGFNSRHLNGEYFELVDDGVVQEEQEVVQQEPAGVEEIGYTPRYTRHGNPTYPVGTPVEIARQGQVYQTFPWGQNTNQMPDRQTQGVVVGTSSHPYSDEVVSLRDPEGRLYAVGVEGVRRIEGVPITQPRSDITPPRAPLSKWLVAVDGNVNLEEGVFDTQEEAEMALVSSDFHNMRQLGHDVRVVSL